MNTSLSTAPAPPQGTATKRQPAFLGLTAWELAVLVCYAAMICLSACYYQQAEDEGRAWMLVVSFPLRELIVHVLRFEGHPALYYIFLWVLHSLGVSFSCVSWFFAGVACVSTYLLLRFSPFPFYLRALLPFGFALGYQFAVQARPYTLFPLLGFLAVHLYRGRPARPVLLASVLALMANLTLHGTMVAIGLAIAYGLQLHQEEWRQRSQPQSMRSAWSAGGIFAASLLFALFCVWPLKYTHVTPAALVQRVGERLLGPVSWNRPDAPRKQHAGPQLLRVSLRPATEVRTQSRLPSANPLSNRLFLTLIYPVAHWPGLALLFESLVAVFLLSQRQLKLLMPLILLAYFLVAVYVQAWHTSLIWVTLTIVLWAAWNPQTPTNQWNLQNAVAGLFALLCLLQLGWTLAAIQYVMHHATYPARATALYLKTLPPKERIDGNELAFSVMPFFRHYIFIDSGPGRFSSHSGSPKDLTIPELLAEHPDLLLLNPSNLTANDRNELEHAGLRASHTFCGGPYFPDLPQDFRDPPQKTVCLSTYER